MPERQKSWFDPDSVTVQPWLSFLSAMTREPQMPTLSPPGRGRGEMGKLSLRQSAGGKTKPKITTVKREEWLTVPHSHPDLSGCTRQSKEALVAVTKVPKAPKGGVALQ